MQELSAQRKFITLFRADMESLILRKNTFKITQTAPGIEQQTNRAFTSESSSICSCLAMASSSSVLSLLSEGYIEEKT